MDKKDIYEHLANIYLDASLKRKNKTKAPAGFKNPIVLSLIVFSALAVIFLVAFSKGRAKNAEIALIFQPEAVKINFNFDPAKKEIYSLNLNNLDLARFKAVGFAVKRANYQDNISLRVEFTNVYREKSEVYIKDIPHKWQDYKIMLANFRNISDWSQMKNLSFIVEEWNTKEKKGVVYMDNLRFLR